MKNTPESYDEQAELIQHLCKENARMKETLNIIAWKIEATNPQAWSMKEHARKGLYGR